MSGTEQHLAHARAEAIRARARLTDTLVELQQRLKPGALLEDAVEELREKAGEMAKDGMEMIKARPKTTAGIAAAVLAFLFRDRLWGVLKSAFTRDKATDSADDEFQDTDGARLAPADMEDER